MVAHKKSTILDGSIVGGLTACTIAISEVAGLTPLWRDAVVYTVILFAAVITVFRQHGPGEF